MSLTRKDAGATILTALVVLVFFAAHEGWNVWLVGGSNRWAAAVIGLLGIATCGLGSSRSRLSAVLGVGAGVLLVLALVTGSLTALSLLVVVDVLLWAVSLARHAARGTALPA